ncbi:hypothetical protein ACFPYM_23640, partial [Methylobacterium hispanicum]
DPRYRALDALEGAVERRFLRPVHLGESIAPFRVLQPFEGIVPIDEAGTVLDARQAGNRGFGRLADWMERADGIWQRTSAGRMTLSQRWNFHNGLANQFPTRCLRVVFSKSGQRPAACIVTDETAIIDHVLYWADVAVGIEAHYLLAVLNSDTVRRRIVHLQARGEQGARHFDKLMFTLPIPLFDGRIQLHADLAAAAAEAERVAGAVPIEPGTPFQRAR